MSVAYFTFNSAESGDDVNAGFALLNAAECDVAAIGRPNRIVVNRLLLREAQWFLSSNELHIDAEVWADSTVPGQGQLLAQRHK